MLFRNLLVCCGVVLAPALVAAPTDTELRQTFAQSREWREGLVGLIQNDDRVAEVWADRVQLDDGKEIELGSIRTSGLKRAEDWIRICQGLKNSNCISARLWPNDGALQIVESSYGLPSGGYFCGFKFRKKAPEKVLNSLDEVPSVRGIYYVKTSELHWYLFKKIDT